MARESEEGGRGREKKSGGTGDLDLMGKSFFHVFLKDLPCFEEFLSCFINFDRYRIFDMFHLLFLFLSKLGCLTRAMYGLSTSWSFSKFPIN